MNTVVLGWRLFAIVQARLRWAPFGRRSRATYVSLIYLGLALVVTVPFTLAALACEPPATWRSSRRHS